MVIPEESVQNCCISCVPILMKMHQEMGTQKFWMLQYIWLQWLLTWKTMIWKSKVYGLIRETIVWYVCCILNLYIKINARNGQLSELEYIHFLNMYRYKCLYIYSKIVTEILTPHFLSMLHTC